MVLYAVCVGVCVCCWGVCVGGGRLCMGGSLCNLKHTLQMSAGINLSASHIRKKSILIHFCLYFMKKITHKFENAIAENAQWKRGRKIYWQGDTIVLVSWYHDAKRNCVYETEIFESKLVFRDKFTARVLLLNLLIFHLFIIIHKTILIESSKSNYNHRMGFPQTWHYACTD